MSKGEHTPILPRERAAIVADYVAGMGINLLRAKYHHGPERILQVVEAAGVARRIKPTVGRGNRGRPRRDLVNRAPGLYPHITAREWGYVAGIFDGEGHLGRVSRGSYYRLTIVQKDVRLLLWLQTTLGAGRIAGEREQSGRNHNIGSFHLEAQRQIFEFCCGVLPYIMVKRLRVLEVLGTYHERYDWELPAEVSAGILAQVPIMRQCGDG